MSRIFLFCRVGFTVLILANLAFAFGSSQDDCLLCHGNPSPRESGEGRLSVDQGQYEGSVHGETGMACTDCHNDLEGVEDYPHLSPLNRVECGACHDREAKDLSKSIHAVVSETGKDTADCADCHGTHDILKVSDPRSRMHPLHQPETCIRCHADIRIAEKYHIKGEEFIKQFKESVHGRALTMAGLTITAVCSACHGSHLILSHRDPQSTVHRMMVPKTCGKCHAGIYIDYVEGVHGEDYLQGNEDVPVCTDCHMEHNIKASIHPESSVYTTHIAQLCSQCHDDERISMEYGLSSSRLKTFLGSYHGVALKYGDVTVANCASCHGYHNIRPSTDPKSSIHPSNIPETCGSCHPRAGINFARGNVHDWAGKESNIIAYYVRKFYIAFIVLLIGTFFIFILSDLFARFRKRFLEVKS
ncbi:MAG: cytochrome c3 family protein [Acidobacteriota bacterium]